MNRAAEAQRLPDRRSLKVDPDNPLVATVLEAQCNTKLGEVEEARAIQEQYHRSDQQQVSPQERAQIQEVPEPPCANAKERFAF